MTNLYTDLSQPNAVASPDPNGFGYDGKDNSLKAVWRNPSYEDAYGKDVRLDVTDNGQRRTFRVNNPIKSREAYNAITAKIAELENIESDLLRQYDRAKFAFQDNSSSANLRAMNKAGDKWYRAKEKLEALEDKRAEGTYANPDEGTMTNDGTALTTKDTENYGYFRDRVPVNNPGILDFKRNPIIVGTLALIALMVGSKFFGK